MLLQCCCSATGEHAELGAGLGVLPDQTGAGAGAQAGTGTGEGAQAGTGTGAGAQAGAGAQPHP